MPWPIITARTASCVYQLCEDNGHTVCHSFGDYYTRLCAVAQLAVDDPTPIHLAALAAVLTEETHLVRD